MRPVISAAIKVVPDLNQLEPTTVALQPFEVVKGVRHEDIRTPPLRYIQYEYTTRLIGDVFFGKDVDIPSVKITYHIQSAIGGGSQGRDQTYALPALAMRVNSLVPKKARIGLRIVSASVRTARSVTVAVIDVAFRLTISRPRTRLG